MRRVSTGQAGSEALGASDLGAVSPDGRWVAFTSVATNITSPTALGVRSVYVCDTCTGRVSLVSCSSTGEPGSGSSGVELAISSDGELVAFESWAKNLVPGDTNDQRDVFVRDVKAGTVVRVSVDSSGVQANGPSSSPDLSADGRRVVFSSLADNLVANDVNGTEDVFLHDLASGTTRRVSETPGGVGGDGQSYDPVISADGRFVAYATRALNLVSEPLGPYHYVYVFDVQTLQTTHVSINSAGDFAHGDCSSPAISGDGRFVAFESEAYNLAFPDWNGVSDVFLHDRSTATTQRISLGPGGLEPNGASYGPSLSRDGRVVAFASDASNLVPGDQNGCADVFVAGTGTTALVCGTLRASGGTATGSSTTPRLSGDGNVLLFQSDAGDLVPDDTNGVRDVFRSTP